MTYTNFDLATDTDGIAAPELEWPDRS